MIVTKCKLNKKLDLLLRRQTMMMEIILPAHFSFEACKKFEKKWNELWDDIMEMKNEN